jgi:16S rRNA (cytidine1402-2'-O)-methyltransferase
MRGELNSYADSPFTLVLFESPHRLNALLAAAFESLGPRRYAICREMTKAHQQVFRNVLPYTPTEAEVMRKGEVTLVIEGKRRKSSSESQW